MGRNVGCELRFVGVAIIVILKMKNCMNVTMSLFMWFQILPCKKMYGKHIKIGDNILRIR